MCWADHIFTTLGRWSACFCCCRRLAARGAYNKDRSEDDKARPGELTGDDKVDNSCRAACNRTEWSPVFFPLLGVAAVYGHPVAAAAAGAVYCYGSQRFVSGYCEGSDKRGPGFYITIQALLALVAISGAGIGHAALKGYAGVDVLQLTGVDRIVESINKAIRG
jgi:hypothetical protein